MRIAWLIVRRLTQPGRIQSQEPQCRISPVCCQNPSRLRCGFSLFGPPRIHSTFPASAPGPAHHNTPSPKQDSDSNHSPESPSIAIPMQALLHLLALSVRCIPAFFRSHREQAIVELALRQQLATYDQERMKPRLTPLGRAFRVTLSRIWPSVSRHRASICPVSAVGQQPPLSGHEVVHCIGQNLVASFVEVAIVVPSRGDSGLIGVQ